MEKSFTPPKQMEYEIKSINFDFHSNMLYIHLYRMINQKAENEELKKIFIHWLIMNDLFENIIKEYKPMFELIQDAEIIKLQEEVNQKAIVFHELEKKLKGTAFDITY